MECPFSTDRLREMRFQQGWRLEQIAVLATAIVDEPVTEQDVREWYADAGIRIETTGNGHTSAPIAKAVTSYLDNLVPDKPKAKPRKPRRRPMHERISAAKEKSVEEVERLQQQQADALAARSRPCSWCNTPVVRRGPSEFKGPHQFCPLPATCQSQWRRALANRMRSAKAAQHLKCCAACEEMKPTSEFSRARDRGDGLARICLDCNREKSRLYYDQNRESVIARVQATRAARKG